MRKHVSPTLFLSLAAITTAFLIIFSGYIFPSIAYADDSSPQDEDALQEQEAEVLNNSTEEQGDDAEQEISDELSDDANLDGNADWSKYFIVQGNTITGLQNGGDSLSELVIPDSMGITAIGNGAFKGEKMSAITLPSTLRSIGEGAFEGCNALKSIIIPPSVEEIKNNAFYGCASLSNVEIRTKSIKSAGKWIFQGCKIQHLSLPDGMTVVPAYLFHQATFDNCEIVIPKSVNTLGVQAFCAVTGVKSVSFEEGSCLTTIEANAFKDYPLSSIELPNMLKTIGDAAFSYSKLTEITLPENLEEIGNNAFTQEHSVNTITRVTLKSSKISTKDRSHVFYGCKISELVIADGVTNIPNSLFADAGFDGCDIVFPASVKEIRDSAFSNSLCITSVSFASGSKLQKIGNSAFVSADFTEIEFPEGLKTIGDSAFRWSSLMDITIPKSVTKIGNQAFSDLKNQASVRFRVVNGSYAYKWLKNNGFSNNIVTVCTITYKLNKGINSPNNNSTYTTGDVIILSDPSRAGFEFDGWYTDSKFRNPTTGIQASDRGNKTFYAKWIAIQYSISYNGADISTMKNPAITYTTLKSVTLKKPKRAGYKFLYWTDKDGIKATKIKKGTIGELTFTAIWKPVDYKISYTLKGGRLDKDAVKKYNIESDIYLPIPVKAGYVFDGWYSNSRYEGEPVTRIEPGDTGNKKFFAKWIRE